VTLSEALMGSEYYGFGWCSLVGKIIGVSLAGNRGKCASTITQIVK